WRWWARQDSNLRQHRYERRVLTAELRAPRPPSIDAVLEHDRRIGETKPAAGGRLRPIGAGSPVRGSGVAVALQHVGEEILHHRQHLGAVVGDVRHDVLADGDAVRLEILPERGVALDARAPGVVDP